MFSLTRAPAVIRPGTSVNATSSVAVGPEARPVRVTEMTLLLHVDPTKNLSEIEPLFPGCKVFCDSIAGDDEAAGEDRTTRAKVPEMSLAISYQGADAAEGKEHVVAEWPVAVIKSKPQLRIGEKGEARLVLRCRVKMTDAQLVAVLPLVEADIRVSMKAAQMDISEMTQVANPALDGPPKREKAPRKGKSKAKADEDPFMRGDPN